MGTYPVNDPKGWSQIQAENQAWQRRQEQEAEYWRQRATKAREARGEIIDAEYRDVTDQAALPAPTLKEKE